MLHIETSGVSAENASPRKGQQTVSVEGQVVACLRPIAKQVTSKLSCGGAGSSMLETYGKAGDSG